MWNQNVDRDGVVVRCEDLGAHERVMMICLGVVG
jgi:hypothetical protein